MNLFFISFFPQRKDASFCDLWHGTSHSVKSWFHTCRTSRILEYIILNTCEWGFVMHVLKHSASIPQHISFTSTFGKHLSEDFWSAMKHLWMLIGILWSILLTCCTPALSWLYLKSLYIHTYDSAFAAAEKLPTDGLTDITIPYKTFSL